MKKRIISIVTALAAALCALSVPASAAENTWLTYEAEGAVLENVEVLEGEGFSGGKYVFMMNEGSIEFSINIPKTGNYTLNFVGRGHNYDKLNDAYLDGERIGEFQSLNWSLSNGTVAPVRITKGKHTVKVVPTHGWTDIDRLVISPYEAKKDVYAVNGSLINPDASASAKQLMSFLAENYGKNVLSGQQTEGGINGNEFSAIKANTGKTPAVMGLDIADYLPVRTAHGANECRSVEQAIEFSKAGGIVTISWHWCAPDKYLLPGAANDGNPRWWYAFNTENLNMDFYKIMHGEDPEGYQMLMDDIDFIAGVLKRLQEADVPVLFRPLHEASGGWFWWGSAGAESYKLLWVKLYEKLTYEHGLNNLIWVWNGQSPEWAPTTEWYPGDDYVDIIGEDVYAGNHVYFDEYTQRFNEAAKYTNVSKIAALSENGCLFDIDNAVNDKALWSWFNVWNNQFCSTDGKNLSEEYTELYMWKKVYSHPNVLSLEDIQGWRDIKTADKDDKADISDCSIKLSSASAAYTGKAKKPSVTVTRDGKALKKGTDYTVSYKNNKKIGMATVTVKGKGNYSGSEVLTFKIVPPKQSVKSLTSGKAEQLKITYKKFSGASGYQVRYSESSSMSDAKKKNTRKTSLTVSGLGSGGKYYVQVRTYKTVDGKTYYGAWSAKKSVSVK